MIYFHFKVFSCVFISFHADIGLTHTSAFCTQPSQYKHCLEKVFTASKVKPCHYKRHFFLFCTQEQSTQITHPKELQKNKVILLAHCCSTPLKDCSKVVQKQNIFQLSNVMFDCAYSNGSEKYYCERKPFYINFLSCQQIQDRGLSLDCTTLFRKK